MTVARARMASIRPRVKSLLETAALWEIRPARVRSPIAPQPRALPAECCSPVRPALEGLGGLLAELWRRSRCAPPTASVRGAGLTRSGRARPSASGTRGSHRPRRHRERGWQGGVLSLGFAAGASSSSGSPPDASGGSAVSAPPGSLVAQAPRLSEEGSPLRRSVPGM